MKSVLSGGLIVALVCGASVALASDADLHRTVRGQLVVIEASAVPVGAAGQPVSSYRMGFAASDDGLVLTTYDLLSSLGEVNSGTVKLRAALATPETRPDTGYLLADIYSEDLKHKLLLLHVKGLTRNSHLKLGYSATLGGGTLLTSGYDNNGAFQTTQGTRTKETGVLWETSLDIDGNQAGAPVYSSANQNIVGIIQEKRPDGKSIVVPMYVARPLLLPISVTDDEAELGEVEKQFQWNLVPGFPPDAKVRLRLCYDNFIPTSLTSLSPTSVSVTTTFSYYDKNGQFQRRHGTEKPPLVLEPEGAAPPTSEGASPQSEGASPDCDGYFDLSQILKDADYYKDQDRPSDKMDILLAVVVTLSDNNKLPAKHFHIQE